MHILAAWIETAVAAGRQDPVICSLATCFACKLHYFGRCDCFGRMNLGRLDRVIGDSSRKAGWQRLAGKHCNLLPSSQPGKVGPTLLVKNAWYDMEKPDRLGKLLPSK